MKDVIITPQELEPETVLEIERLELELYLAGQLPRQQLTEKGQNELPCN